MRYLIVETRFRVRMTGDTDVNIVYYYNDRCTKQPKFNKMLSTAAAPGTL